MLESGEPIIVTADGAVKARDFRRKPEYGGRWGNDGKGGFKGVPLEPCRQAGGGCEIKSKVRLPTDPGELTKIVKSSHPVDLGSKQNTWRSIPHWMPRM